MSKTTCLENFRMMINRGEAEWMPFTLDVGALAGFTRPILDRFRRETGSEQPEEYFDYDFRAVSLKTHFGGDDPAKLHKYVEPGTTFDEWGIGHWAGGAAATYEKLYHPLASAESAADVETLPAPRIIPGEAAGLVRQYHQRGYPVFGYAGSIYEWSWWLRGMQDMMADFLANPDLSEAVIRKVTGYTRTLALESARAGIDILCFYDDAGMQTGMQISPALWRRFIKPRWKEVLDAVRGSFPDCAFFLHSCGKIDEIIPDIIEVGFDILHPVQPECMDFRAVRERYGRDLILCACISAQNLFPFGTPDEIKTWVKEMQNLCASDRRAIFCPSNAIQPETPWENITAFAEAVRSG